MASSWYYSLTELANQRGRDNEWLAWEDKNNLQLWFGHVCITDTTPSVAGLIWFSSNMIAGGQLLFPAEDQNIVCRCQCWNIHSWMPKEKLCDRKTQTIRSFRIRPKSTEQKVIKEKKDKFFTTKMNEKRFHAWMETEKSPNESASYLWNFRQGHSPQISLFVFFLLLLFPKVAEMGVISSISLSQCPSLLVTRPRQSVEALRLHQWSGTR